MNHVVHRLINVDRWYAHHSISIGLEPSGFSIIRLGLVTCAVHFYNEALRNAHEIDEVGSDWNLPAKLVAAQLSVPEARPYTPLGLGHVVAEISGLVGLGRAHRCRIGYRIRAANAGR
jgi:hypothetical protein